MLRVLRIGLENVEHRVARRVEQHGVDMLRWAVGIVFLWFGLLKFCPGLCDVELLAGKTVRAMMFGLVPMKGCIWMLAVLETWIGVSLLTNKGVRLACWLLFGHLCGTFLPLMMFPEETWKHFPYSPTLTGQYILKNLILLAAASIVAAKAFRKGSQRVVVMPRRMKRSVA